MIWIKLIMANQGIEKPTPMKIPFSANPEPPDDYPL
jgi:hypothetical protein